MVDFRDTSSLCVVCGGTAFWTKAKVGGPASLSSKCCTASSTSWTTPTQPIRPKQRPSNCSCEPFGCSLCKSSCDIYAWYIICRFSLRPYECFECVEFWGVSSTWYAVFHSCTLAVGVTSMIHVTSRGKPLPNNFVDDVVRVVPLCPGRVRNRLSPTSNMMQVKYGARSVCLGFIVALHSPAVPR